ncbi:MAG: nickel pincer cofactor biosynthesis protein LarB [Planctomycetes bacterium]|nr:nickel pincer cofactor biosynthesis protein LarB [Planctomycetota bacterium]
MIESVAQAPNLKRISNSPKKLKFLGVCYTASGESGGIALDPVEPAVADLGYAHVDLERRQRCGFPEVIYCEGKTCEWVEGVVRRLIDAKQHCLATRVNDQLAVHLSAQFPSAQQDRVARTFWLPSGDVATPVGRVMVITAGTSDLPVAREALVTAQAVGASAELIADVGVAGIHRLLRHQQKFADADVIIVVAGMDGALPSVVGGLVDCPVIAVPTSVGYGAAFSGLAPLLTMLNACSANVVVVNIDAGFKAGYVAALIARRMAGTE